MVHYPTRRELVGIRRARSVASKSHHRCKHGSVVMKGSRVTVGHNKIKNHPRICWPVNTGVHAEVDAAREHSNTEGAICIVIRLGGDGELMYSHPCDQCQIDLRGYGIKRVIYSDPNSSTGFSMKEL